MIRFLFLCVLFVSVSAKSQTSNLIVAADDSTKFFVYLNESLQYDSVVNNIKIEGLTKKSLELKVVIDSTNQELKRSIFFEQHGVEATIKVLRNGDEFKLLYFGEVSMGAAPHADNQVNVSYKRKEFTAATESTNLSKVESYSMEIVNGKSPSAIGNISASNVPPSYNDMEVESPMVDITEMDSAYIDSVRTHLVDSNNIKDPAIVNMMIGYKGEKGCKLPDLEIENVEDRIKTASFSSQKLKLANQSVKDKCVTTQQVEIISNLLEFEDDKLAFVKFAYSYTYDQENYKNLVRLFNFTSTKSSFLESIK